MPLPINKEGPGPNTPSGLRYDDPPSHPLRAVAASLPRSPGVYLFKDRQGKVLYVGKAVRLRDRVRSYFAPSHQSQYWQDMVARLLRVARRLEHIITSNEREALVLEASLIQLHRAPFNVRFIDDKRYPYLKLTNEPFPRVTVVRRIRDDGARYFGPFTDMKVKQTVRLVRALFGIRDCRKLPDKACLNCHIGLCSAPCVGKVDETGYARQVRDTADFLRGRNRPARAAVRGMMERAAARKEFERAADLRDHLGRLEALREGQAAELQFTREADVIALDTATGLVVVLHVRGGRLLGHSQFKLDHTQEPSPGEVMAQFMAQYYGGNELPPVVLVGHPPHDLTTIQDWLTSLRGSRVTLTVPRKGEKRRLLDLAQENLANLCGDESRRPAPPDLALGQGELAHGEVLDGLQWALGLHRRPTTIEGFDVSTLQGNHTVGARVTFQEGLPDKSRYRRYRTRRKAGQDDYAAMDEMLGRRLARGGPLPDWLLIDGGAGHLSAAALALESAGLVPGREVELVGLAKREELIHVHGRSEPIALERTDPGLRLLQRVRDEAHRFGLAYHRLLRSKGLKGSAIEDIPGIGPTKAAQLLSEFGSLEGIRRAGVHKIAELPGWSDRSAGKLKKALGP